MGVADALIEALKFFVTTMALIMALATLARPRARYKSLST